MVADCCCEVDAVDDINGRLRPALFEMLNTTFFRHFHVRMRDRGPVTAAAAAASPMRLLCTHGDGAFIRAGQPPQRLPILAPERAVHGPGLRGPRGRRGVPAVPRTHARCAIGGTVLTRDCSGGRAAIRTTWAGR